MKCSRIGMLLVLGLGPVLAAGSYTFTSLAVPFPGATETIPSGINNPGTIVGTYEAAGVLHGFVLQNGTYTAFDPPGSTLTLANGINVGGDIVGTYVAGAFHGFILQGNVLTTIDFLSPPGVLRGGTTQVGGINKSVE